MRLKPTSALKIDCYLDADFAGLYVHDNIHDLVCIQSRTGFVITVAYCLVLWQSKLQMNITLSTMEAEYMVLSTSCKKLFPIIDLFKEHGSTTGLQVTEDASVYISIYEDN